MSYTQFGYTSYATTSPFVVGPGQSSTPQGSSSSSSGSYEKPCGSPEAVQSSSAAAAAASSPAYDAQRLLSTRLAAVSTGFYGGAPGGYAASGGPVVDQGMAASPYASLEPASPFYPAALNTAYGMKDSTDPWRGISQTAPYYYDPTLAAYGYGGLDFNGARRKNVTRDSTSTLKAWLNEHRKNPYPTKGEKIMLAIITKMTLTQVSTWFANARRRLKKENKMTWEPRNKSETQSDDASRKTSADDEDDDCAQSSGDGASGIRDDPSNTTRDKRDTYDRSAMKIANSSRHHGTVEPDSLLRDRLPPMGRDPVTETRRSEGTFLHHSLHNQHHLHDTCRPRVPCLSSSRSGPTSYSGQSSLADGQVSSPDLAGHPNDFVMDDREGVLPGADQKPKIWSLADTATNKAVQNPVFGGAYQNFPDWTGAGETSSSGYGSSLHGFVASVPTGSSACYGYGPQGLTAMSLQTDTPPQTPPNMKVSLQHLSLASSASSSSTSSASCIAITSSPSNSSTSYSSTQQSSHLHLGSGATQSRLCCSGSSNSVFEDQQAEKKPCDVFATSPLASFSQAAAAATASPQCIREDYASTSLHYREPHQ